VLRAEDFSMPEWISRQLEFQGLHPWWAILLHGGVVVLAGGLIFLLHRYEGRLVPRHVSLGLLTLRLGVLGLVLLLFLQPVLSWTINGQRSGRILVGVDQSQSMQSTDPHATRAEKLRWARGLAMVGNEATASRLDAWQAAFDRGEEPEWATAEEAPDPRQRDELAATRRENLLGILAELNQLPRVEIARRLLTDTPVPLLKELQKLAKVELFVFAGKSEPVDPERLARVLAEPSASVNVELTDLAGALSGGPSPLQTLGVVLFTDGRQTAKSDPAAAAAAAGRLNVPIFPVLLGTTNRPKDLAIPSLDVPTLVYQGDQPLVKALLQTAGFEDKPLTVELRPVEEDKADRAQTKSITPSGPLTPIEFQLPSAEVGKHSYVLSLPVQEGETRDDNNARSFTVTVIDDRARVLLVDGEPRWEFRYLEAALARDERASLRTALFRQPWTGLLPETFFPRTLPADQPSPFDDLDVVILGDAAPWDLTEEQWNRLESFVAEGGGTLVLSAGKKFLPAAYRSAILDRLLPVSALERIDLAEASAEASPARRGLRLDLTPEGETQLMFRFSEDPEDNRRVWGNLPGPVWAFLAAAKPAATVWMTALTPEHAELDAERQRALIVHQYYGFGQVVWMGFDATWRWRHRVGDKYHHQFWGQLVRWAASSKIAAGNEFVRFGPEQAEVEAGRDVVLRARWSPQYLQRFPEPAVRVELSRLDAEADVSGMLRARDAGARRGPATISVIDLRPKQDQPVIWEARVVGLPPGEYRATLMVENADLGRQPVEAAFSVRPPLTPELVDTSSNRTLLAQMALASGGRLLLPDELGELPRLLRPEATSEAIYRETPLWDRGAVLVLFFILLTSEWVIRKWNGLP
jgi:hypothetical protein